MSILAHSDESRNPDQAQVQLKKRAEEMAGTRLRITEAAIELHGTVGPSRTTLTGVAKRAGVERRTLYSHFPTRPTSLRLARPTTSPPTRGPTSETGARYRDPQQRLERALDELYAYYERTEPMLSRVLRDARLVDFAREAVAPLHDLPRGSRIGLATGPSGSRPKATTGPRAKSVAPRARLLDVALALRPIRHRAIGRGAAR